jgi:putative flavoprotein involved in K+ transport
MPFPAAGNDFVGKDLVADYLEQYATSMRLPVRLGVRVDKLESVDDRFEVTTVDGETIWAHNVIVAMADYQKPYTPELAADISSDVYQVHSARYRNPQELRDGEVLVVGFGNSGTDIAFDVSATHSTVISGTPGPSIPFPLESWFGVNIGTRLVKFVTLNVLSTSTPMGRKARPKMLASKKPPLVRVRPPELRRAGVRHVSRITGVEAGRPVTEDGEALDVSNIVWCTGYRPGFVDWLDVPVLDASGKPVHQRGVTAVDGLYFLGLFFLHAVWSETIPGVQRDARYVVEHLVDHRDARRSVVAS